MRKRKSCGCLGTIVGNKEDCYTVKANYGSYHVCWSGKSLDSPGVVNKRAYDKKGKYLVGRSWEMEMRYEDFDREMYDLVQEKIAKRTESMFYK